MNATSTKTAYRIVCIREIAPGWWGSESEVGETASGEVAYTYCHAQNAVTMNPNRSVRKQYYFIPAN